MEKTNKMKKRMAAIMAAILIATLVPVDLVQAETEEKGKEIEKPDLNYLYVDQPYLEPGDTQYIVVSVGGEEKEEISDAELVLECSGKADKRLSSVKQDEGVFLFQECFDRDIYHVKGLKIFTDSGEKEFSADDLGVEAYFGVGKEYTGDDKSDHMEMEPVTGADETEVVEASTAEINEDGDDAQANIEHALRMARSSTSDTVSAVPEKELVLFLDPGHDTGHTGARGNGIKEEEANLKIANYCKEELEKYEGVSVFLTRDEKCPYPETIGKKAGNLLDIKKRVYAAAKKDADAFISFHLNSWTGPAFKGAEVYYHKSNAVGKKLSQKVQNELKKLGLYNRGIKNNEAYMVIQAAQRKGFPGIIIEHAYLSNKSDASNYLKSNAKLKKLGKADAVGIAEHYGLKKRDAGTITVSKATKPDSTKIRKTTASFDKIKLIWEKVSGASGYQVQRYDPSEKRYVTVKTMKKGSTVSYTNDSLNAGRTYKYRVRAYKKSGSEKVYGSWSTVQKVKTEGAKRAKIKTAGVNVRKGAGTSYKSLKKLNKGAKVKVIGSKGSWYRVSLKIKGKTRKAYILKKYVKIH